MTATQLRTTQLGETGLEVTRLGFGACTLEAAVPTESAAQLLVGQRRQK